MLDCSVGSMCSPSSRETWPRCQVPPRHTGMPHQMQQLEKKTGGGGDISKKLLTSLLHSSLVLKLPNLAFFAAFRKSEQRLMSLSELTREIAFAK